jgi:hypothetical protein
MEVLSSGAAYCRFGGTNPELFRRDLGTGTHVVGCVKASGLVKIIVDGQVFYDRVDQVTKAVTVGSISNALPVHCGGKPGDDFTKDSSTTSPSPNHHRERRVRPTGCPCRNAAPVSRRLPSHTLTREGRPPGQLLSGHLVSGRLRLDRGAHRTHCRHHATFPAELPFSASGRKHRLLHGPSGRSKVEVRAHAGGVACSVEREESEHLLCGA